MSGATQAITHPVLACAQQIATALSEVAEVDPLYMSPADQAAALRLVQRDLNRLEELQLRLLAAADEMTAADGARDPAGWIAHHTRLDRADARRRQRLARALGTRWRRLGEALRDGDLTCEQAQVITRALDDLPTDLDPTMLEQAEKHLIAAAGDHDPRGLRILGRKILEVIAPEIADEHEAKALADQERQARKKTWIRFRNAGDGTTYVRGRLPTPIADRLRAYLDAFASPRRPANRRTGSTGSTSSTGSTGSTGASDQTGCTVGAERTDGAPTNPDRSPYDVRVGRALCSLLEHWDPARLPIHGGAATTVMVTIDLESLRR
ncbi:DUF222 domain-containing protein, partial [Nocardioides sp.]|uniref:DUF222 domain-containing protein n=1 Tax=Nocardioides sp. TaxID=35761 RepID=UPI002ED3E513